MVPFLIFGINEEKSVCASIPEKWIVEFTSKKEKIDFTIDKDSKNSILKELDTLGINESILFPELDNQARYLKNKYG